MRKISDCCVGIVMLGAALACVAHAQGSGKDAPGIMPFRWFAPPARTDSVVIMEYLRRGMRDPIDNMPIYRAPDSVHYTMIVVDPKTGNIDHMPILGSDEKDLYSYEYRRILPDTTRRPVPERLAPLPRSRAPKKIPREK